MFTMLSRIFIVFSCCVLYSCSHAENRGKFVIDNDAGGDDAMAIFISLLYEKHYNGPELIALTTVNGNTNEDNVCSNDQKILRIVGRQDVPIYRGAKSSLVSTPVIEDFFGKDGLGDSGDIYFDLVPPQEEGAVDALIRLSKTYEDDLTVITLGSLTNVALAIKLDPGFIDRINHLYVGGGHLHSEVHPGPEFNVQMDVEAYHIVANNATPDKVTVLPFSQIWQFLNFSKDWRENVLGGIDSDIVRAMNKFEAVSLKQQEVNWLSLDPAVIISFLRQDLIDEYKYSKNDIILCGERRGININTFVEKEEANVRMVYSLKTEAYRQFLLDIFTPK